MSSQQYFSCPDHPSQKPLLHPTDGWKCRKCGSNLTNFPLKEVK